MKNEPLTTSKQNYVWRNCFLNYYLKNMYITLKGIGKLPFVSMLTNLLISKFINFTIFFNKPAYSFSCVKVSFNLINTTHVTIYSYEEHC